MFETQSQELELDSLRQGDIVWLEYYQRLAMFEEHMEDLGYLFKNIQGSGFSVVNNSKVYATTSLMKELF